MKKLVLSILAVLALGWASAQTSTNEVVTKYNEAVAAMQAKDWGKALPLLEQVVDKGIDSEDNTVLNCVQTAKKYIPTCYQSLGTAAASQKAFDKAIEYLNKAAEKAELYGNNQARNKANVILAKVYQVQGGEAFNNKDYAAAAEVFAKGYAANPRNTDMALNLAMSYCEMGEYEKGMEIYNNICALPATERYAAAIAKANEMKALYTNNEVAKLQGAGDNDAIIAMADKMLAADPASALAEKIRLQAYNNKKDYAKVIELGESAALAQTDEADRSDVYFILGAAYNAKEMKEQAVATLKKVTAGNSVEAAKKALADLVK